MYGKKPKTRAVEYSLTRDLALCSAMPDSAAPGTAHWAPLSLRSPRQEYWSRVPFPTAGDLLHPEIEPASLVSPASAGRYFTTQFRSVQFSSVVQSCPTLCDPMNCSTPGLPVHHKLPESTQTHVHWVGDAIQPSHPLSSNSPPARNPSQHQGLFQWVKSLHDVAKVLEFQLQHQSFQWTPRTDLL